MKTIGGIILIIASFFGAYQYLEVRYALSQDVKQLKQDVEYDRTTYQLDTVQNRILKIEQEYEKSPMPKTVNENLKDLKEREDRLKNKLKVMEKK